MKLEEQWAMSWWTSFWPPHGESCLETRVDGAPKITMRLLKCHPAQTDAVNGVNVDDVVSALQNRERGMYDFLFKSWGGAGAAPPPSGRSIEDANWESGVVQAQEIGGHGTR